MGVSHKDAAKIEATTGMEPTGDFIRTKDALVMIGDIKGQPLPFTVNREPDETFYPKRSV